MKQYGPSGRNYTAARPRVVERAPSSDQLVYQSLFRAAGEATRAVMNNPEQMRDYAERFKNQRRYSTLRGFIFATLYREIAEDNKIAFHLPEETAIEEIDDTLANKLLDHYWSSHGGGVGI
ncbi:MAG: hypothetical protein NC038_06730 [Paludibacter sp.]|nr:hypothetical protein [Bacteroidales bacterium]MCM1069595.1 hypothetical protein [Prevotella sp.]MCM1354241.1 hypothetical protein [Bacteroides sp.]MCM1403441.1 hypothetical protein [Bacteroides sp.]MCM1482315.1 hypothetical protein [Paludibacter sp.]